jgi:hypothetical protein
MTAIHDGRAIPATFGTLPAIDGYQVIAEDTGRPVAHRETLQSANGVAFRLNNIAASGSARALATALGRLR